MEGLPQKYDYEPCAGCGRPRRIVGYWDTELNCRVDEPGFTCLPMFARCDCEDSARETEEETTAPPDWTKADETQ